MAKEQKNKNRLVVSYHSLTAELQEELRRQYPNGYEDSMIRIDKGPEDFFYAVFLETEEVNYLIKVDVKIDDKIDDEDDKEYYDDDIKGADDLLDEAEDQYDESDE